MILVRIVSPGPGKNPVRKNPERKNPERKNPKRKNLKHNNGHNGDALQSYFINDAYVVDCRQKDGIEGAQQKLL